MNRDSPNLLTRRHFIRQAACAAVGTSAITSTLFDLRLINSIMAQGAPSDYKALVCLFLYGGNDANNLLVPRTGEQATQYALARANLAIPSGQLLPINPVVGDGRDYGIHPACPELQTLFEAGNLAFLCNVGTLVEPITRAEYKAGSKRKPPQLFSHNDQQVQWQTSIPDQISKTGWGGRCADLMNPLNYVNGVPPQVSMAISLAGFNTFQVGDVVQQYQVATTGAVALSSGSNATRQTAMNNILALPESNLFEKAFGDITERAIVNAGIVNTATGSVVLNTPFPTTSIGSQLKMIAQLIGGRNALGLKRQIFFCSVGGYDTHGEQLTTQAGLFGELSQAVKAFHDATVELGVADAVTLFTGSDFGRTFPSNGVGSDHGWGSHQMVVGGAVNGKELYGTYPTLAINGPDDTGSGRWIPTTSVDQYSATLARWFGVGPGDLQTIFPNISRFGPSTLGFLPIA